MSEGYKGIPMKDIRGYLTIKEVRQLLESAKRFRDQLLLRLLWVTGARISEIVGDRSWYKKRRFEGLKVKDVVWEESTLIIDTLKRKEYPPPKRRTTVDATTLGMLKQYVEEKQLRAEDKVFKITRQRAHQIIREIGQSIGISKVGEKLLHNHHLRHSHCVAWVRHNNTLEGLRKLQRKLGHANINTTAHYLQFAPEEQREIEDIFGKW